MSLSALLALVLNCARLSAVSFGGIFTVWALAERRMLGPHATSGTADAANHIIAVSPDSFARIFSAAQVLPGPAASGFSMLGYDSGGFEAMLAIYMGLVLPGLLLTPMLLRVWRLLPGVTLVRAFRRGALLATLAVLLSFAASLLSRHAGGPWRHQLTFVAIMAATFLATYVWRVNPLALVVCGGVIGYFVL